MGAAPAPGITPSTPDVASLSCATMTLPTSSEPFGTCTMALSCSVSVPVRLIGRDWGAESLGWSARLRARRRGWHGRDGASDVREVYAARAPAVDAGVLRRGERGLPRVPDGRRVRRLGRGLTGASIIGRRPPSLLFARGGRPPLPLPPDDIVQSPQRARVLLSRM